MVFFKKHLVSNIIQKKVSFKEELTPDLNSTHIVPAAQLDSFRALKCTGHIGVKRSPNEFYLGL